MFNSLREKFDAVRAVVNCIEVESKVFSAVGKAYPITRKLAFYQARPDRMEHIIFVVPWAHMEGHNPEMDSVGGYSITKDIFFGEGNLIPQEIIDRAKEILAEKVL